MHLNKMVLASLFAILTAIGAQIRIPFPIVPLTLQTLFVLLSGLLLGKKWGSISMGIYLMMGLIGLPVFASGGGLQYIAHPSFGFLVSFIPAAWVAGFPVKNSSFTTLVVKSLLAFIVVYTIGIVWLYMNLRYLSGKDLSFFQVIKFGLFPFIPGAILKMAASSWIASRLIPRISIACDNYNYLEK